MTFSTTSLSPEITTYLEQKGKRKEVSDFIRKAIKFYYDWVFYPKAFLIRVLSENYALARHILRQIGAGMKLVNEREKNGK